MLQDYGERTTKKETLSFNPFESNQESVYESGEISSYCLYSTEQYKNLV